MGIEPTRSRSHDSSLVLKTRAGTSRTHTPNHRIISGLSRVVKSSVESGIDRDVAKEERSPDAVDLRLDD
jgi:hypothetical protein